MRASEYISESHLRESVKLHCPRRTKEEYARISLTEQVLGKNWHLIYPPKVSSIYKLPERILLFTPALMGERSCGAFKYHPDRGFHSPWDEAETMTYRDVLQFLYRTCLANVNDLLSIFRHDYRGISNEGIQNCRQAFKDIIKNKKAVLDEAIAHLPDTIVNDYLRSGKRFTGEEQQPTSLTSKGGIRLGDAAQYLLSRNPVGD